MQPSREFWKNRKAAVIGGTGFLGGHLVRSLLDAGASVRAFGLECRIKGSLPDHPELSVHIGDVNDLPALRSAAGDCDVVFNAAGGVTVCSMPAAELRAQHERAVRHVLAASNEGARVVHTSSVVAVGASRRGETLDEGSAFNLKKLAIDYIHAKRGSETAALDEAAKGRDVVVVNPGYLIGPVDYNRSVMGRVCERFWKGRLIASPGGGLNFVDVRDVAAGHLLAAERGRTGERYILGGVNLTVREFLHRLAAAAKFRPRALPDLPPFLMAAAAAVSELRSRVSGRECYPSFQQVRLNRYHWYYDSARARSELGFEARPLEETLRDAYAWYAAEGRLRLSGVNRWWMRPAA